MHLRCDAIVLSTRAHGEHGLVVRALTRPTYGWANHPAVLMWKGYEEALGRYGFVCCEVWTEHGFGDTCAATIAADLREFGIDTIRTQVELAAAEVRIEASRALKLPSGDAIKEALAHLRRGDLISLVTRP